MGRYTNLPTLDIDYIKPGRMSFDTKGGATSGGRNGLGQSVTMETSGGGIFVASYTNCYAQTPEEHEYLNWVAARMNNSIRFINVPILSDWAGPFPFLDRTTPQPIIKNIPHSDGALFSDGAGYSQATVFGTFAQAAALNAGQVTLNIFGNTRNLRWSDWFSIYHPTKGWRAYRYWETSDPISITETIDGVAYTGQQYVLALDIPLREAVTAGTRVEFARPRCVMKFPVGFSLPWEVEGWWLARPTMSFEEAF